MIKTCNMSARRPESSGLIGEAPAFVAMLEHVSQAAALVKPVLVIGERGTGKELIASRLHCLSERWDQPLVKINCAALTESLLESELFGHDAGAFTGASRRHIGRFEQANGGTLILDELGTIPLRMQEKILRVIEYGEFQRVGGSKTLTSDARINFAPLWRPAPSRVSQSGTPPRHPCGYSACLHGRSPRWPGRDSRRRELTANHRLSHPNA